jgi:hypothetical protein
MPAGVFSSQVPRIINDSIDGWIRTDGNDETGDGTANSADKAFRTINGAWDTISSRYSPSTRFAINLRLGIPGTYDAGFLGPYGGVIGLYGDVNNRQAYRIRGAPGQGGAQGWALETNQVSSFQIAGVTLQMDTGGPFYGLIVSGGTCAIMSSDIDNMIGSNNEAGFFGLFQGGKLFIFDVVRCLGNGGSFSSLFTVIGNAAYAGSLVNRPGQLQVSNANFSYAALQVENLSLFTPSYTSIQPSGTSGKQYLSAANSIIRMYGQPVPGNQPGSTDFGGQFIPGGSAFATRGELDGAVSNRIYMPFDVPPAFRVPPPVIGAPP